MVQNVATNTTRIMANEFEKDQAISELLGIDLKCPHCGEILETAEERNERSSRKNDQVVPSKK